MKPNQLIALIRAATKGKRQYTVESWMIANGKTGDVFYSTKIDRNLTAIALHHGRRITTERIIAVSHKGAQPKAINLTKVTLL